MVNFKSYSLRYLIYTNVFLLLFFNTIDGFSQFISIDEEFSDWDNIPSFYEDALGDKAGGIVDFGTLKITNDDHYIYLYLEVGAEINLQQDNSISLLLDIDQNSETGESFLGIGYELIFNFGQRNGQFFNPSKASFNSYDIGLVSAPTVTSTVFEIKLNRNAEFNGNSIFDISSFDFLIRSAISNGDLLPDNGSSTLTYSLNSDALFTPLAYSLEKDLPTDLRVLSYNVERDNLFNPSVKDNFRRIFQAIKPDIIGLEEVYDNSGQDAATLIEEFLPSGENQQWYSGDTGNDNLIVSRYPVIDQSSISGNAAYLLDLEDHELLVIVAHPPCCSNNENRQKEIDEIMAFVRDSKNGQQFNIADNTPIIIVGDMNLVGFAEQQTTLLTGDILNENEFGPAFSPDWDGTALEDLKPQNPGLPTTFTWYSSSSSFSAGRLDYIVYTGSVLEAKNNFSLFTLEMDPDSLTLYGLDKNDTILASDHLPLVGDFQFKTLTNSEKEVETTDNFKLFQNYPNPFNPSTNIHFQLQVPASIKLEIYDVLGRTVELLFEGIKTRGNHMITFNAASLPSGLYYYTLSSNDLTISKKMLLLK